MNKNYIWVFAAMFMIAITTAAWMFTIDGSTTASIVNGSGLSAISLSIPDINVDTSSGASSGLVYSNNFVINKNVTLNVFINETFTDSSNGTCSNGQSDCSLIYKIANVSDDSYADIQNGDNVSIIARPTIRNITVEMSCEAYSCPQTRDIDILLTQI